MVGTWSKRTTGYKVGVLLLFLASVLYLLGFLAPFWYVFQSGSRYTGLWMICSPEVMSLTQAFYGDSQCLPITSAASWFRAVQSMETIALIALIICCVYALVVNCCKRNASHNRVLEILTSLTGLCGFIACMVFVALTEVQQRRYLGWAFGVNLTGCLLLMIVAAIIYGTNRADLSSPTPTGVIVYPGHTGAVQDGHIVLTPLDQGYPSPPQSGTPYAAPPAYGYNQGYPATTAQQGYPPPAAPSQGVTAADPPPKAGY